MPALRIIDEDWGGAPVADLSKVFNSATATLWKYFPNRQLEPIVVIRTRTGPMVHFERNYRKEIVMNLDAGGLHWSQFGYQYAHEFCHILANFDNDGRSNLWFEETICETASLFALRHMADAWRFSPPYPNWKPYASALDEYADDVIKSREKIPSHGLSEFYRKHADELRANPTNRTINGAIAVVLLDYFEKEPEHWESVTWMNSTPSAPDETFEFYFAKWLKAAPPRHQLFIASLRKAFGVH